MKPFIFLSLLLISQISEVSSQSDSPSPFGIQTTESLYSASPKIGIRFGEMVYDDGKILYAVRFKTEDGTAELKNTFLAKYDKANMNLISSELFFPKGTLEDQMLKYYYGKVLLLNNTPTLIFYENDYTKGYVAFYKQTLSTSLLPVGNPEMIYNHSYDKNGFGMASVIELPNDEGFVLICTNRSTKKEEEQGRCFYALVDNQYQVVAKNNVKMWDYTPFLGPDELESATGGILFGVSKEQKENQEPSGVIINPVIADLKTGLTSTVSLDQINNPLSIEIYADETKVYCFGYYQTTKNSGADGIYSIILSRKDMSVLSVNKNDFPFSFTSKLLSGKKDDEGAANWAVGRNFFVTKDGGFYLIGEQYAEYSRSTSQGMVTTINCGSILVSKIDANGKVVWNSSIPRWTSSGDKTFMSFSSEMVDNQLYFFYYDSEDNMEATNINDLKFIQVNEYSRKLDLVGAVMNQEGKVEKYRIYNNKESGMVTPPKLLRKVNPNLNEWFGEAKFGGGKEGLVKITLVK